ncbi:MAG: RnfABCDGE type electron transport complex subunit D [Pseudomonadota bacterium]
MRFEPALSPYLRPETGVGAVMREVSLALVPAAVIYFFFFGFGILFNIALCIAACVSFEALALKLRGLPVATTLSDCSAILTGVLLAFALPTYLPVWVTITACGAAVLLAKHVYGGIGFNPFNPAMLGYAFVLIAFPVAMSSWLPPAIGDLDYVRPSVLERLTYLFTGGWPAGLELDAITRATPLDLVRTAARDQLMLEELRSASPMFGDFGGRGWEWIGNFIALGGGWLLYRGIIRWHIPVAVLAGMLIPATLDSVITGGASGGPGFHLFSGATLLGAFFIATDPVSAATSPRGRLIYGFGIGFITWVIRKWGGYPDGIAFAVLLMNAAVPLIDHFTAPRILGRER